MYDEHNERQPGRNENPAQNNQNQNAASGDSYRWNQPGAADGAYHSAGGQRETVSAPHSADSQSSAGNANNASHAQESSAEYVHAETVHTPHHNRPLYEREHFTDSLHNAHVSGGSGSGHKGGGAKGKIIALALVCGLVGGTLGSAAGNSFLRPSTTVQVSDRTVSEVKQMKVDGKTELSNAENYAANVNSVVSINVGTQTNYFGQTVEQASSGSGFILTQDGYILTNYHVVENANTIKVTTYAGDSFDAEYIGGDEDYDIAVIKIEATGLSPVTIGDSTAVNVGDNVIAIGNPLGELTFSLTSGSVSSANRAITVNNTPFSMIQVDCSINPGNSGGPLLNSYGEVIGIVSAKYSSYANTTVEGLGFAIPINDVYAMVKDIMENGYVTDKAYLGITGNTVTEQLQAQYNLPTDSGVFVYSIEQNGTAASSGLQAGDIIIKLGDKTISSMTDLLTAKKEYKAGDTVKMTVNRSGSEVTLDFTFDVQPQESSSGNSQAQQNDQQNGNSYYYSYGNPFSNCSNG